jgi:hypothetical protein
MLRRPPFSTFSPSDTDSHHTYLLLPIGRVAAKSTLLEDLNKLQSLSAWFNQRCLNKKPLYDEPFATVLFRC